MREEIVKVYTFAELSPEAQAKAIEKYRESIDWDFESQYISENFKDKLEELGMPTDDLEWRLSHSQGDGVAFYGYVDVEKVAERLLEGEELELYNQIKAENLTISAKLYRNSFGHHYSHYNTMEIEMDGDNIDTMITYLYESDGEELTAEEWDEKEANLQDFIHNLGRLILKEAKEISINLEREGYEMIEYIESDESIKEGIEANEYEFTADGKTY